MKPTDYHTYAKLIQIYYHQKDYEKAKPYREKLYAAQKKGLLEGSLASMFCYDQFKWNDKLIQAYERFEEGSKRIYIKHLFYVVNKNNEIDYQIQTEYSPISIEQEGPKYVLCEERGKVHASHNFGFNDDFKYEDLKKSVIDILEGKRKPAASSRPNE